MMNSHILQPCCSQLHVFTVGAILEHEAIAGLSAAVKPSGMRARTKSTSDPTGGKEQALDNLIRSVSYNIQCYVHRHKSQYHIQTIKFGKEIKYSQTCLIRTLLIRYFRIIRWGI